MARITICDLCKKRIKECENRQGKLVLSFCILREDSPVETFDKDEVHAELCQLCTTILRETIAGEKPLPSLAPKSPKKKPEQFGAPAVEHSLADAYGEPGEAIGPSEEEKADRRPTKELLEDEIKVVASKVDIRKGSKSVREINRKIVAAKGNCDHHFKSWENGKVTCGPAPDGFEGELASFKGCGRALSAGEY